MRLIINGRSVQLQVGTHGCYRLLNGTIGVFHLAVAAVTGAALFNVDLVFI
jgi:hypothetical protein